VLARLPMMNNLWVTKDDYDEIGGKAVNKCERVAEALTHFGKVE